MDQLKRELPVPSSLSIVVFSKIPHAWLHNFYRLFRPLVFLSLGVIGLAITLTVWLVAIRWFGMPVP